MIKIGEIELGSFPLLLAPMEDVSDPPFRSVCKQKGADLMYTEFISSEGLIRQAVKSCQKLDIFEYERPIGIQLFGGNIESMIESTVLATQANPDLIDINYGCPVKAVACRGAGAALLQDIPRMIKMTKAVIKNTSLPVTVKTRLGWDDKTKNVEEIAEQLQDVGVSALTIHGRTRAQMYKGSADWTLIGRIKNNPRIHIPVFGNGDINTAEKAVEYQNKYGVDGIMIGRAAIGNPWIFSEVKHFTTTGTHMPPPKIEERIQTIKHHLDFSISWKGERLGVLEMRKHYANYFKNLPNSKPIRMQLVEARSAGDVHIILDEALDLYTINYIKSI